MLDYTKSFIEVQFPVSKLSKESYKERKAAGGQTLTGLGKWWGRKPLILVRATILGVLLPVSENLVKDREIFLKILTMDNAGLWSRKSSSINAKEIYNNLNPKEKKQYFELDIPKYIKGLDKKNKDYLQELVFYRLSYDKKLTFCSRPEHVVIDNKEVWGEINDHLETNSFSIQELVKELGEKRYGHTLKVGDCFCGGGSIPFEAARMGADVYASDLNPVAGILTWSNLNIAGADNDEVEKLKEFRQKVYNNVNDQIVEWGIETNENGDRANAYLYCIETTCPELMEDGSKCGYRVPLAPSWIIGEKTNTVAILRDNNQNGFDIEIIDGATDKEMQLAEEMATIKKGSMVCPHCKKSTTISAIRKDTKETYGLRQWGKSEFVSTDDDVFTERLYCIKYIGVNGKRYYVAPSKEDMLREHKVLELISERFTNWQENGYIPSTSIESGYGANQLIRERGWTQWHQLFNHRQLLLHGLFLKNIEELAKTKSEIATGLLGGNRLSDWDSKLCIWNVGLQNNSSTFVNQALNTLYNYGTRGLSSISTAWNFNINKSKIEGQFKVELRDARTISEQSDLWITDPPYADAVNYHELAEFFLAWDKVLLEKAFPEWYTNSKRVLAVKGTGQTFNESMIDVYKNLDKHMNDNGTQVVMFTHQDVKVWAELAMILWSSGLKVVSAWNIATETESGGLKAGNYVKGTVILTLKKQNSDEMAFQDELYDEIKYGVESIIDSMRELDDKDDPDFTEADYLLASYAASLKIITAYKEIDGIDVPYWLSQSKDKIEDNPIEAIIKKAVKIAYDYLIPEGFNKSIWKDLTSDERFFIRGIEIEMSGSYQINSYQELARGFGVKDYKDMFAEFKANATRLMTPSEFKMKNINKEGFNSSIVRHILVALNECTKSKSTTEGVSYLRSTYTKDNEFWYKKSIMLEILLFITKLENIDNMTHWHEHAYSAKILKEALKNDGI